MKFMILVKSTPELEARLQAMSDAQMKDQWRRWKSSTKSSGKPA